MSYGAGHVMDMINRMKQNRAQRPSKRAKFKENNCKGIYSSDKTQNRLNYKTIAEKELNEIKKRIRENAKAERKRERIFYGVFIVFGLTALIITLICII